MSGAIRYRRTTLLSVACAGALTGLWLGRYFDSPGLAVFLSVCCLSVFARRNRKALVIFVGLGCVLLGWWRGEVFRPRIEQYYQLQGQRVVLQAEALEDSVYGYGGQLTFDVSNVELQDGSELTGRIVLAGRGVTMVYRGDIVQAEGVLNLARGSRQARMSFATITVVGSKETVIDRARRAFTAGILSAVPEPQASFGLGLLVGQRDTLPEDVADELSTVGLTHLIAVSGYNLTVIVMAARRLLGSRSKYQTFMVAVVLIVSFLLVTGFSASIVRAAIVSGLSLVAWYYGRTVPPLLLIGFAAAITAMWFPFYIWFDIGWYLSFLAFFGVLIIAPLVQKRFFPSRDEAPLLPATAIESFSAQLMTIPIIMFTFGRLSVVSLLANILVVPFTPFAMLASLLAGISGSVLPAYAGLFAWPATLLLSYMLSVASLAAKVPFASVEITISLWMMFGLYLAIIIWVLFLARRIRRSHGTITDVITKHME
jgi:competence protein ComEC